MSKRVLYLFLCLILSLSLQAQNKTSYENTLLWRIGGNGLAKESYLYGTMHLKDRRLFQFTDSLYAYLEGADGYAMEVDPDAIMEALMKEINNGDGGEVTPDELDKETSEGLKELGMKGSKVTRRQLWLYRMQQGWNRSRADDMNTAVDLYLYNIAHKQGKWVGGIEDVADQIDLIKDFGDNRDVSEVLLRKGERAKQQARLMNLYLAADLNAIDAWCNASLSRDQKEKLLLKRNRKMTGRIDSMAHVRSHFFAVGAAHLPGTDGLIELLRSKGFQVSPVLSGKKLAPEAYKFTPKKMPWVLFESSDKTFSVQMPGKAVPYSEPNSSMAMNIHADLGTGQIYLVTDLPISADHSEQEAIESISKNYAAADGVEATKQVLYKGRMATQVDFKKGGYYYRMRLVPNGTQVVMLMVGGTKKEQRENEDADRFYESAVLSDKVAPRSWYSFANEAKAYSVQFPAKPVIKREPLSADSATSGEWRVHTASMLDVSGNAYYFVIVKEAPATYFIKNDQTLFEERKQQLEEGSGYTISRYDTGHAFGYPAVWMRGTEKTQNLTLELLMVNRGGRSYNVMAIYDSTRTKIASVNKFFESFQLTAPKSSAWQPVVHTAFSTVAPAPFQYIPSEDNRVKDYTVAAYDSANAFSFGVDVASLSRYYWATSDSACFEAMAGDYFDYTDSVVHRAPVQRGDAKGYEYLVRMGDNRNYQKLQIFLHADSVYTAYFLAPQSFIHNAEYKPFFEAFRFTNHKPVNILRSKAKALLQDLNAADSASNAAAKAYLSAAPFVKEELPLLHHALLQDYPADTMGYYNIVETLRDKIVAFKDESTVHFAQQVYAAQLGTKAANQYRLLRTLAGIKTAASYDAIKSLLQQAPAKGEPGDLAYMLEDSMLLAQRLYPDILHLAGDSLFAETLATLTVTLIDSGLLSKGVLEPYHQVLMAQATTVYTSVKGDKERGWNYFIWTKLLGRMNTKESNALLQQVLQHPSVDLKYEAILALTDNNQPVAPTIMEQVAGDLSNRIYLYRQLEKRAKLELFPKRYATQRSIAESEMWDYAYDEDEPSEIKYIGERTATLQGKQQRFYLFKITYAYEGGKTEYLGITGGYPMVNKGIVGTSEAIGFGGELNGKNVDALFQAYLKDWEAEDED